jgi:hypothetical protein
VELEKTQFELQAKKGAVPPGSFVWPLHASFARLHVALEYIILLPSGAVCDSKPHPLHECRCPQGSATPWMGS